MLEKLKESLILARGGKDKANEWGDVESFEYFRGRVDLLEELIEYTENAENLEKGK